MVKKEWVDGGRDINYRIRKKSILVDKKGCNLYVNKENTTFDTNTIDYSCRMRYLKVQRIICEGGMVFNE